MNVFTRLRDLRRREHECTVELTKFYLKHKAPKQRKQPAKPTKRIPRATHDEVMIRDSHRCNYVGGNGRRCTATHDLQIDHIRPRALGGTHEPQNLRVLCGAHNRHEARRILGDQVCEPAARWSSSAGTTSAGPTPGSNAGTTNPVPARTRIAGTPPPATGPSPRSKRRDEFRRSSGVSSIGSGDAR